MTLRSSSHFAEKCCPTTTLSRSPGSLGLSSARPCPASRCESSFSGELPRVLLRQIYFTETTKQTTALSCRGMRIARYINQERQNKRVPTFDLRTPMMVSLAGEQRRNEASVCTHVLP